MSQTTNHGENIANQVQTEDAYGDFNDLSNADVYNIVDNLHTHMMDSRTPNDPIFKILENVMRTLEKIDKDLPL